MTFSQAIDSQNTLALTFSNPDGSNLSSYDSTISNYLKNTRSVNDAAINGMISIYNNHVSQGFYDSLEVICNTVNPNGPHPIKPR